MFQRGYNVTEKFIIQFCSVESPKFWIYIRRCNSNILSCNR